MAYGLWLMAPRKMLEQPVDDANHRAVMRLVAVAVRVAALVENVQVDPPVAPLDEPPIGAQFNRRVVPDSSPSGARLSRRLARHVR